MKKLFLSLVAAIVAATTTYAQSSMVATLSHNGTLTNYYGSSALKEAYNAAKNGDIITLSSGSFTAVNITKAITLHGAGMEVDTTGVSLPTTLVGDFSIEIPDTVSQHLTMEGVFSDNTITCWGTLKYATFLKCRLGTITYSTSRFSRMKYAMFIHCKITNRFSLPENSSASLVNCYVNNPSSSNTTANYEFTNCLISNNDNNYVTAGSSYNSCIIYLKGTLDSSNTVNFCVGQAYGGSGQTNIFSNITFKTNKTFDNIKKVFKTYDGTYNDSETFELTDEAKTQYLGSDGTQVGMYGGDQPYSAKTLAPQITKCEVGKRTTADGKLNVNIVVKAAD